MDLGVAIGTAAIYVPYVQRFSRDGLMARQHMNMALLAYQVNSGCQQLGVARSMRRVTVETVFANRCMLPQKRSSFLRMAGVTKVIDRVGQKHPPGFTSVRVVAGGTTYFHVPVLGAKQMCGALVKNLSLFRVAREANLFFSLLHQQFFRSLRVMGAVAA